MKLLEETGYSKHVLNLLRKYGVEVFDRVQVSWKELTLEGVLLPRPKYGNPNIIILKLDNGYNIGLNYKNVKKLKLLKKGKTVKLAPRPPNVLPKNLPKVMVLGTGGTIASRIDYTTGAVYPSFSAEDIYGLVPELAEIAEIETETVLNIFSEDMTPKLWEKIAERAAKRLQRDGVGIVIAHGTDTMAYTAAALSFAINKMPAPIALVGAQRSSDRPSSDTALNLIAAVKVACEAPFGEVVITMHGDTSDNAVLVHRGTKVRKCHTSRRDAFRTVNAFPLAIFRNGEIKVLEKKYKPRCKPEETELKNGFDDKVALVKFFPGMHADVIEYLIDKNYHGIVIEATGLGHVGKSLVPAIERAVSEGIPVAITSQCIWGRVNLNVYRRGVELLKAGVIPCEDMLPETAYVKLSWILNKTRDLKEIRRMMLTNYAFEINHRSCFSAYISPLKEVEAYAANRL